MFMLTLLPQVESEALFVSHLLNMDVLIWSNLFFL
jgi:hypothetical protein